MNDSKSLFSKNIIILVIVFTLCFWSFIPAMPYAHIFNGIAIILIVVGLFILSKRKINIDMQYKNIIIAIIALRFISSIPCYLYHGQDIIYTLAIERVALLWLFYFFLHKSKISPDLLIKIVVAVAFTWAIITILQQFSYPLYAFATREDKNTGEIPYRAGVYRFIVRGLHYGILVGLMYLTYLFTTRKSKYLYLYLFFFASIYFHSARQFIAGYLFASLSLVFFMKGINRKIIIAAYTLMGLVLILNFETLFSGYILQSQEDINEDNIRIIAYDFFGIEYFPHWLCKLFGNGMAYSGSSYGNEFFGYINEELQLFRTDVGIVGTYNQYGLVYSLLILYSFIKVFTLKMLTNRVFLKLFSVVALVLIILTEYSYSNYVIPFFCIYYYLIDCYVKEYEELSYNNPSI